MRHRFHPRITLSFAGALLFAGGGVNHANAQRHAVNILRGRVTTDSGIAVSGADVIVLIAPTASNVGATTDSTGAYAVIVSNPTGEYVLYISAVGRKSFRQRVTILGADSVATVNVKLSASAQTLAAVRVRAQHPRPGRALGSDGRPGATGTDQTVGAIAGSLPPDEQGSLDALAAFVPGLSTAGGTASAYGLGAEANSATLNGLAFGGTDLPRDARMSTRFRTSPWDPTIGGFSGVQTSVTLDPGGNVSSRKGHITIDAPALQASDPVAARTGQQYTNLSFDEGGVGALALDRVFYNYGLHVARQSAGVQSPLDADPALLTGLGIAPDSAAKLLAIARARNVPVDGSNDPRARTTTTLSFIDRIDRAPNPPDATAAHAAGPTLAITTFGKYAKTEALALAPTVTPSASGATSNGLVGAQALYSRYFGTHGDNLNETTSGLSLVEAASSPYATAPAATVLMTSTNGVAPLMLGGNGTLATTARQWTWETLNRTAFLLDGKESLPVQFYLQSRFDGFRRTPAVDRYGTYTYASLADFASNEPSSYSRTLNVPTESGGEWIGAAALGGDWIHDNLTLMGGARIDANAFMGASALNADVDQRFGVRTNNAPDGVSISPRLAFVWRYTPTLGYLSLSTFGGSTYRGTAQLRGGIGKFRGTLPATTLADASAFTGLPGEVSQLVCVGAAVPQPNWGQFAVDAQSIPSSCAADARALADTGRVVSAFSPQYQPSESWRANLGWTTSQFFGTYLSIDGIYSTTRHIGSSLDLNFSGTPQFTIPDEGNRPVFVTQAGISPGTGLISPVGARSDPAYGRVTEHLSDLHSDARQLVVTVMPNIPISAGFVTVSYAFTDTRTQARGFDANTAGDPRVIETGASPLAWRHSIVTQWTHYFAAAHMAAMSAFRAYSGVAFTPLVSTDINGDGLVNDRAFVFDPKSASDPAAAAEMRALLDQGSGTARACLAAQLGRVAGRNSCTGPWGTTMNGALEFVDLPHLDNRTRLLLYFSNITAGLDQLLHGADRLRGWGSLPLPNATLLETRGFDPGAERFAYTVNPHFGSTSPSNTLRLNPFRVTLDVEVGLGRTSAEQRVEQTMRVRPSLTGTRASPDTIKARYLRVAGTDVYALLLRLSDSLALSRAQVDRFRARQPVLRAQADSIYSALAHYLADLPPSFSAKEASDRVDATRDSLWKVIRAERGYILSVLTPGQLRRLNPFDGFTNMLLNPKSQTLFFAGGWSQ